MLTQDCLDEIAATLPPDFDLETIFDSLTPPPAFDTPEEKLDFLNNSRGTSWHYFGTAALVSVVDPTTFEVLGGVTNLHVVDASVFPNTTLANPQPTIMALALVAAQRIVDLYGIYAPSYAPTFAPTQTQEAQDASEDEDEDEDSGDR